MPYCDGSAMRCEAVLKVALTLGAPDMPMFFMMSFINMFQILKCGKA